MNREKMDEQLLKSAGLGDFDGVALALAGGASMEARGQGGETPLMKACGNGHSELARALIDAGADVEARADDGQTVADRAAWDWLASVKSEEGEHPGKKECVAIVLEALSELDELRGAMSHSGPGDASARNILAAIEAGAMRMGVELSDMAAKAGLEPFDASGKIEELLEKEPLVKSASGVDWARFGLELSARMEQALRQDMAAQNPAQAAQIGALALKAAGRLQAGANPSGLAAEPAGRLAEKLAGKRLLADAGKKPNFGRK